MCYEAISPSSGLWRSVYSGVHKAWFCNFMQIANQNLLFSHRVCRLFCCAVQGVCTCSTAVFYGWKLLLGRSNTWRFVFTQISVTTVFLCRGPQGHQGVGFHHCLGTSNWWNFVCFNNSLRTLAKVNWTWQKIWYLLATRRFCYSSGVKTLPRTLWNLTRSDGKNAIVRKAREQLWMSN